MSAPQSRLTNAGFTEAQATVLADKFDAFDRRFDQVDGRLEHIENRVFQLTVTLLVGLPTLFVAQTTALALILGG
jgi:hypothetical protein